MPLSNDEISRYSRQLILDGVGVRGQRALKSARVLVVGAGGLGSPAALYLAGAGIGTIGIADADVVDASNLQRQIIHTTERVGMSKVASAAAAIEALNPNVSVERHETFLDASNAVRIVSDYDFVLDGTDSFPAKFLVNDACVIAGKPFSHAGILRWQGQLMTYVPGQGPCYRCVFRDPPPAGAVPSCREAGVIGALAGVIGSLQALEAIKYVTGAGDLLVGRMLTYDALAQRFHTVNLPAADTNCPVCGSHPTIHEPVEYEQAACAWEAR